MSVAFSGVAPVYSDAACSRVVTGTTISQGQSRALVYVKGDRSKVDLTIRPANFSPKTVTIGVWEAVQVAVGQYHTCAVLSDGTIRCWGLNDLGQLGDGSNSSSPAPVGVRSSAGPLLTGVKQVAVSARSSCARLASGTVMCWGQGALGQLGNGLTVDSATPVSVMADAATPLSGVTDLSGSKSGAHYCAVYAVSATAKKVKCWGSGGNGRLGYNSTATPTYPVDLCDSIANGACPTLTSAVQVAAGVDHSCALFDDQSVYCWGTNGSGQLGSNSTTESAIPKRVQVTTTPTYLTGATSIAAGAQSSCATVNESGVSRLMCWGYGWRSGDPAFADRKIAGYVKDAVTNANVEGVAELSLSAMSCYLSSAGRIYCWGPNQAGATLFRESLGLSLAEDTGAAGVKTFSVGPSNLCSISESTRDLKCSGGNGSGQLGSATVNPLSLSVVAGFDSYAKISHGSSFSCGVTSDASKAVMCWGWNRDGRAGLPATATSSGSTDVPTAIGLTNVTQVEVGSAHACAVKVDGTVWCWGGGASGRLGNNATANSTTPVQVGRSPHPTAIAMDGSGRILLAGDFPSFDGRANTRGIVRLTTAGAWDSTFASSGTSFNGPVLKLAVQADGKILAAGEFTAYGANAALRLARLNADGTFDSTLVQGTGFDGAINSVAVQADGKIVVVGDFSSYNGAFCGRVARLTSVGALDSSWTCPAVDSVVDAVAIQSSDGKILIAGAFDNVGGSARSKIARLNTNGTLDATFDAGVVTFSTWPYPFINRIVLQTDGKILIAGEFDTFVKSSVTTNRRRIARLTSTGDVDSGFLSMPTTSIPGVDNPIHSVALQSDGKIVLTGDFTGYVNAGNASVAKTRILRLDSAGVLETAYVPTLPAFGVAVVQSDDKVVVAGPFTSVTGSAKPRVARLLTTGVADTTFTPGSGFGAFDFLAATSVEAGDSHACALSGGRVYCWGAGASGRLGNAGTADLTLATAVRSPEGGGTLMTATAVAAGGVFNCAMVGGGRVVCWGASNGVGALGVGMNVNGPYPGWLRNVGNTGVLTTAQSLYAGYDHGCVITTEAGSPVKCWGSNGFGQLGDQTTSSRTAPVSVLKYPGGPSFDGAVELALSPSVTCARLTTGGVWCWGLNTTGRLGLGFLSSFEKIPSPLSITGATALWSGVTALNTSARVGSRVKIWGTTDSGLLGDGAFTRSPLPVDGLFD